MNKDRQLELLAYAKVCFDKCTSPFELTHLVKKNVTADECRDLSGMIADALDRDLSILPFRLSEIEQALAKAEKEFTETQIQSAQR